MYASWVGVVSPRPLLFSLSLYLRLSLPPSHPLSLLAAWVSTNLYGRDFCISTLSPTRHNSCSSCVMYFLVRRYVLPYLGSRTMRVTCNANKKQFDVGTRTRTPLRGLVVCCLTSEEITYRIWTEKGH